MVGSEIKATTTVVAIAINGTDRRANKRGEATTDN
jgi:hypothetical protein